MPVCVRRRNKTCRYSTSKREDSWAVICVRVGTKRARPGTGRRLSLCACIMNGAAQTTDRECRANI